MSKPDYSDWSPEKRAYKLKRGALGWSDENLPNVSTMKSRPLAEIDPAQSSSKLNHDVMVRRRLRHKLPAYPPGSLGRWVEPSERPVTVTIEK